MPFFSTPSGSNQWYPMWSTAGYPPFTDGAAVVSTTATGNGAKKALLESVVLLEQLVASSRALSAQHESLCLALTTLKRQALRPIPEHKAIANALAQVRHLTQHHTHETAARTIFEFASQAPEILRLLKQEQSFRY